MNATSLTHSTGTLTKYTRWLTRLFTLLAFLVGGLSFTAPSAKAASLLGESVTLTVTCEGSDSSNQAYVITLHTSTFTVGAGVEVNNVAVSGAIPNPGFASLPFSGNITVNVGDGTMTANYTGLQGIGSLNFKLSSVLDQSAGQVTATSLASSSGFTVGINQAFSPSSSNTGNGSVTAIFFWNGLEPGQNQTETINFTLADAVAPVLTNLNGDTVSYTGTPVVVDNQTSPNVGLSITDNDAPSEANMGGATMTITNFQAGDVLSVTPTAPITASYLNGVLTLSGTSTRTNYRNAIRAVTFSTSSGSSTARSISTVVTDTTNRSSTASVSTVNVTVSSAAPTITTPTQTSITTSGATLGGNVTADGGAAITARGVVISQTSLNNNPAIGGGNVTNLTTSGTTGVFTVNATGLTPNTGYSFKAYATNSVGTTYTTPTSTFTTVALPTAFTVTGGGSYNAGGSGVAVGLSGSQTGVNYQLFIGASTTGSPVAGTGAAISFGNQTAAGTYTVVATNTTTSATNNMTGSATVTINPVADVSLSVLASPTPAVAGNNVTYTATVTNNGPSTASNVIFNFPYPSNASFVSRTAPGGWTFTSTNSVGQTAGTVAASIGSLANGASGTFTLVFHIGAGIAQGSQLSTTATASSDTTDLTPGNNSSPVTTAVVAQADLSITMTDGVTTATPGGSVTYTITVSNTGPSNVTGATVADTFPASLTATWTGVGAGGGTATASGSGNINDTVNLPAGGSVTYTVSATISAGATGTLSNTATVTSSVTDPTPGNNSATDSDTLTPQADLSITKTDGVTVVNAGGTVTYTITASNAGPSNAPGTTVADTLPASLSNVAWTAVGAGGGTVTASGSGNINDTVNLPAGGSVTYTVTADISGSASGTLSNTATVSAPGGVTDPTPGNNSATDSDSVNTAPIVANPTSENIAATKVTLGGEVTGDGGLPVTVRGVVYSLTATNAEPVIGGNGVTNLTTSGTTGVFTVDVTGLVPNSGYSFKAYATNSIGTNYSSPASTFTTLTAPEIAIEQPAGTDLTAGTASIVFGTVDLGSNAPQTFFIKNSGSAVLNITSVSTTGGQASDFVVNTGGMLNSLPITNGQTTFTVTFTPGTAGAKQTTLRVVTDDEDESTFDIALTGTGNALPTLTLPASPVLAETTVLSGTTVDFTVTANDAEDGALTPSVTPPSGSNFPRGDTTVNVSATDSNGAVVTGSFVVRVQLTTPVNTPTLAKGDAAPGAGTNGLPADAKLSTFGMPAIDEDGSIAFVATWTSATGGKGKGLFTNTACIALVGAPVPGVSGAKYKGFSDPVIDGGRIASIITMAGVPAISGSAVLTANTSDDIEIVARAGDVATTDGAKFKSFKSVEVRGLTIAFAGKLITGTGTPKATIASDEGVWVKDLTASLVLALREGQTVGERKIKTLTAFDSSIGSRGQGRGWLELTGSAATVQARVIYTDTTQAAIRAKISGTNVDVTTLLHNEDVFTDGRQLTGALGLPALNAAGQIALRASTASDRGARPGIEVNLDGSDYTRIAARDQSTPGSSNFFSTLQDPVLAEDGSVAFPAKIRGTGIKGASANTLWWQPVGGSLTLLARGGAINGGAQNDLPSGAQWSAFNSLAIAADRGPIFSASLVVGKGGVTSANSKGVWAMDYQGKLQHLFRTGETINGKKLKNFTLLNATAGNAGVTRSFSDNMQVVWLATFTDASQAVITTQVP